MGCGGAPHGGWGAEGSGVEGSGGLGGRIFICRTQITVCADGRETRVSPSGLAFKQRASLTPLNSPLSWRFPETPKVQVLVPHRLVEIPAIREDTQWRSFWCFPQLMI